MFNRNKYFLVSVSAILVIALTIYGSPLGACSRMVPPPPKAADLLATSGNHVKTAIVMHKKNLSPDEAKKLVESADGFVRRAIE